MSKVNHADNDKQTCDIYCYDEEIVNDVKPKIKQVDGVEQIFKALADSTRLKIAYALTIEKELCVCDVAHIIGAKTATASHHLRLLKNMDLAKSQRKGKQVFYSLKDDHVRQLIYIAMVHAHEEDHDV